MQSNRRPRERTLLAADGFFAGAAFFLVTPTGLLALVAGAFFVALFAPVLAVARFLVVVTSGTSKTLGREFPVTRFSMDAEVELRAELQESWRRQHRSSIETDRSQIEYPHEPLLSVQELVKVIVVVVCDRMAHSRRVHYWARQLGNCELYLRRLLVIRLSKRDRSCWYLVASR
jgi:hypothetical protein